MLILRQDVTQGAIFVATPKGGRRYNPVSHLRVVIRSAYLISRFVVLFDTTNFVDHKYQTVERLKEPRATFPITAGITASYDEIAREICFWRYVSSVYR